MLSNILGSFMKKGNWKIIEREYQLNEYGEWKESKRKYLNQSDESKLNFLEWLIKILPIVALTAPFILLLIQQRQQYAKENKIGVIEVYKDISHDLQKFYKNLDTSTFGSEAEFRLRNNYLAELTLYTNQKAIKLYDTLFTIAQICTDVYKGAYALLDVVNGMYDLERYGYEKGGNFYISLPESILDTSKINSILNKISESEVNASSSFDFAYWGADTLCKSGTLTGLRDSISEFNKLSAYLYSSYLPFSSRLKKQLTQEQHKEIEIVNGKTYELLESYYNRLVAFNFDAYYQNHKQKFDEELLKLIK